MLIIVLWNSTEENHIEKIYWRSSLDNATLAILTTTVQSCIKFVINAFTKCDAWNILWFFFFWWTHRSNDLALNLLFTSSCRYTNKSYSIGALHHDAKFFDLHFIRLSLAPSHFEASDETFPNSVLFFPMKMKNKKVKPKNDFDTRKISEYCLKHWPIY